MLDIGWSELLVIAVVLIVVVGPKDLPPMIRAFGKTMAGLRKMAGEFRSQFDEALKEADMDDVRQTISDVRNLNPTNSLRDAMNPLRQLGNEIKSDLQKAATPDATAAPATSEPVAPLVSVPEAESKLPDLKLPDTAPVVPVEAPAAPVVVAASEVADTKPKRARAKKTPVDPAPAKSAATVEAEVVASKPKRVARTKATAASDAVTSPKTSEPAALKPARKTAVKKPAAPTAGDEKAAATPAKPKARASKAKKDEA